MKRKSVMILTILLMSIGFASISTVLYLNGQTYIASNQADFDVYFSKAIENRVEKNDLIQDKTHISFTTELKGIDDKYVLEYEVTNASKNYDANCGNLVELDLSSFDTSNVTDMRFMFASGIYVGSSIMALERIKGLENFDMSNVTDMEYLFKNCNALVATINIRGTNCTSYTNMFENAATENGAKITVNYTEDAVELVDKMIATKSSNSNVIKGSIVV